MLLAACSLPITREGGRGAPSAPDATGATVDGSGGTDSLVAPMVDAAGPPTCNGYEPCGVNPVVVPTGYTLLAGVNFDDYGGVYGSCLDWADCGMWDLHFTSNWTDGNTGQLVADYYNTMSSPFPWGGGRYEINVLPKRISYVKLHVLAPGDMYRFNDGTLETQTDRATGQTTCFQRSPGHMESANLDNLGGTGNTGPVTWTISVLPGDMGNSGNASTCTGTDNTGTVFLTSDPAKAALVDGQGQHVYCLLREGADYYINFMSAGTSNPQFPCATATCSMGGLTIANFVGSDGSQAPQVGVPCE